MRPSRSRPRPNLTTIALAAMIAVVGLTGTGSAIVLSSGAPGRDGYVSAGRRLDTILPLTGEPTTVRIPAIGVDADLDRLGLDPGGALEAPPYDRAGWFGGGPKPGELGPAVIAAHVDSTTGPAVFFRLESLHAGDAVTVGYDDGTTVDLVVTGADRYPKSDFPTEAVYGPTNGPDLRLITCIGRFDRDAGSYDENLVVWATATTRRAPALT